MSWKALLRVAPFFKLFLRVFLFTHQHTSFTNENTASHQQCQHPTQVELGGYSAWVISVSFQESRTKEGAPWRMESFKGSFYWMLTMCQEQWWISKWKVLITTTAQNNRKSVWAVPSHQMNDKTILGTGEMLEQWRIWHQALRNHWWKQAPLIHFNGYKYIEKSTYYLKKKYKQN